MAVGCSPARRSGSGWKRDRKSTRLNSSHQIISYAVFCLKKKKNKRKKIRNQQKRSEKATRAFQVGARGLAHSSREQIDQVTSGHHGTDVLPGLHQSYQQH